MVVNGELELAVMDILWSHAGALSVRDVHDQISADRDLAYTTVMTVLDRLAKKGAVVRNLDGRAWLYRPARSKVAEVAAEALELLSRLDEWERKEVLAELNRAAAAPSTVVSSG
ncbi:MAG: BlaI/MecI/CopY family transcriptional regulator [Propionicimonas sp.]|uniref:BlaI/MecI/CopY family transcriptional regulator n=1 Tax=Propionicimonas sp. TaxID=1955623 RepID=UPI003D09F44D